MTSQTLTIVTINTGKGDGPYERRLELLAEGLSALAPDVVFLQESLVAPDINAHTTNAIAERLGMRAVFAPARRKQRVVEGRDVLSDSGLGVLTRQPVRATTTIDLPADPADGERIALLATFQIDGCACLLANVHLSHLRGHDALRRSQMAAVLAHPWFTAPHHIRLVGGDLNTPLDRLPDLFDAKRPWTWRDAYEVAGGPEPRATVPVSAAPGDGACIDFVLSIASEDEPHPQFRDARIVLDRPDDDGIYPSDHRGVMVDLIVGETEGVRS